jgi:CHASE2 domain-containing sensor protein/signal transduction histidine kinase
MSQHSLAYQWAIVTAAVTLIVFVLVAGSWTWKLDQVLYDAGLSLLERPAREDVVVVAIDDESIAELGPWPWRRATVADLIDRVSAARPEAVGIDLLFVETDERNPGDDKRLAAALRRTPNPVLPVLSARGREVMPIRGLAESASLANVDVVCDPDGVLRRVFLQAPGESKAHMAQVLAGFGRTEKQVHSSGSFPIPFIGPREKIRHVSAAAILRGEIPASTLTGKLVLIGVTASRFTDSYPTPSITGSRQMAGVEVTANVLSALLDGSHIHQLGNYSVGLVSAAAMLLLLMIFYRVGPSTSLYLMFATVFLTPLLALVLLRLPGIWFPPMSVAISALVAYTLWHWKRLEAICHYLDEEIIRLESDRPDAPQVLSSGTIGFADYIQNRIELIRINISYLRAARKFLAESLDGLPYAALVVAPDGKLVVANRQTLDLCKGNKADLSGCRIETALADIRLQDSDWQRAVASVLDADGGKLELKASGAAGREFEVALALFRNDEGVISGLIVVLEDVTELRQAQREREDALSFLSHDIRSPQNSIMALAELQRHDETRKPESEFVSAVEALAQKTMMLAEEFLQLARADSKQLSLAGHDLLVLVEDCIAEINPQAEARKVSIQVVEPSDRVVVMADRSLITRAICNLFVNAVKYTPEGGKVCVRCTLSGNSVICSITDSGAGIPSADLPKLFKRFSQLQKNDAQMSGSGLGLAFVDVVARRHNGQAKAESVSGQGATFSLVLPILHMSDEAEG